LEGRVTKREGNIYVKKTIKNAGLGASGERRSVAETCHCDIGNTSKRAGDKTATEE